MQKTIVLGDYEQNLLDVAIAHLIDHRQELARNEDVRARRLQYELDVEILHLLQERIGYVVGDDDVRATLERIARGEDRDRFEDDLRAHIESTEVSDE